MNKCSGYCVDCVHLREHPLMAETFMDSGGYVQRGFYQRCEASGRIIAQYGFGGPPESLEYQHCMCNRYVPKKIKALPVLIPDWMEKGLTCAVCGKTRSVKYDVSTLDGSTMREMEQIPVCNRCVTLFQRI